ncbi:MAG: hypothetical protein ACH344_11465, partial [Yersinia sp. (in: enterobacteria)]
MGDLSTVLSSVKQDAAAQPQQPAAPNPVPAPAQQSDTPEFQQVLQGAKIAPAGQNIENQKITPPSSEDEIMRSMSQKRQAMQDNQGGFADFIHTMRMTTEPRILNAFTGGMVQAALTAATQPPSVSSEELEKAVPFKGEDTWKAAVINDVVRPSIAVYGQLADMAKIVA